jgi:hypothetical protein
MISPSLIIIPY